MLGTGGGFVCPPFGRHARAQRLWQQRCMPPPSSIASTPVRVAVVEDDAACRTALAHALQGASDMRLAWTAASRTEAMAALRARWPQAAAMVSTIFGDEVHVLDAIAAGAMGYLLKDLPATAVVDEVRSLHAGGSPINPMVARKLLLLRQTQPALAAAPPPPPGAGLGASAPPSAREAELLRLVARGHTLDEVARAMGVSRHTVRTFVRRVYAKLQVTTQAEAVSAAARQGWIHAAD